MLATYFDVEPELSQPQSFPAIVDLDPDWYTSVMVVRQAEAARITSDIFARLV